MINKIFKAVVVAFALAILPVLGNVEILYATKIWILVLFGISGSVLQPDYSLVNNKNNTRDYGTEAQIIWSVFITQLLAVLEAAYLRYPNSIKWDIVSVVALAFMILGFVLRTWSIHALGRFFTMHLTLQEDQQIIREGPYKYFRHPSYAGAFLTYMGTSIFLHSWYSAFVAAIILPIAWIRRMRYEEEMLLGNFGEEYEVYRREVKRIIPGVW